MHPVYHRPIDSKISHRHYRSTDKPFNQCNSFITNSPHTPIDDIPKLARSYSAHKKTSKLIPSSLKTEFNLCSSKKVFVFARKSSSPCINPSLFISTKENRYRKEMTQQVFCYNYRAKQIFYRSMARSSNSRRQKAGSQLQPKRPHTQQHSNRVGLNPQPWQMKGQGHDLESLL